MAIVIAVFSILGVTAIATGNYIAQILWLVVFLSVTFILRRK